MPVSRPRRRFAYFADAGKVGRPVGRNYPYSPAGEIPTYPFRNLTKRADDIRPYPKEKNCPQRAAAGRPYAKKESPKARETVPFTESFSYGRRRETKFPAKFFAKLSFKKAGGE